MGRPVTARRPDRGARKPAGAASRRSRGYTVRPIGILRSPLASRAQAPRQGFEGGPDAWLELRPALAPGLHRIAAGDELIVVTWLHRSRRSVLKVRKRRHLDRRLWGVFATRSPDRPNPLGLHRVTVRQVEGIRLRIGPIEAIDGTPVLDLKPVIAGAGDW
jgi:tRNA-Thr(GGU) m(6)t(6)A37 methyltransferase TsaA